MNILLVEDDEVLSKGLIKALQGKGFVVNHVSCGKDAIHVVRTEAPDMMVLDIGLPDITGLEVLKTLRPILPQLPVLMLTARDTVEDKVAGLDAGADDYLAKPFDIDELIARLRVFERRLSTAHTSLLIVGDIEMDTAAHTVSLNAEPLLLSRREYMLLKALMEGAGKVFSKEQLENKLYSWGEEVSSNTIEVHIHHLRKKLPKAVIKNIRGIGYTVQKP